MTKRPRDDFEKLFPELLHEGDDNHSDEGSAACVTTTTRHVPNEEDQEEQLNALVDKHPWLLKKFETMMQDHINRMAPIGAPTPLEGTPTSTRGGTPRAKTPSASATPFPPLIPSVPRPKVTRLQLELEDGMDVHDLDDEVEAPFVQLFDKKGRPILYYPEVRTPEAKKDVQCDGTTCMDLSCILSVKWAVDIDAAKFA